MEPAAGDTCMCWRQSHNEWVECEILLQRDDGDGERSYFVHYANINKRWDEWVPRSSLDEKTLCKKVGNKGRKTSGHGNQAEENAEADLSYFGKMRNIEYLRFAHFKIKAWYFSPVPDPFDKLQAVQRGEQLLRVDRDTLYCCEFCMRFFRTNREYEEHCKRCDVTHPPGDEIYRCGRVSAYEVDGAFAPRYCVNLCLITKLFLFHKAEYYQPGEFHFYVVCMNDVRGAHPIGFFSKEKQSQHGYNLACILTFPCYQKMGIGRFLVQLSYEFSKIEKRPGSPEKPLSDLGFLTYRSYWKEAIVQCLYEHRHEQLSFSAISNYTGMSAEDVKFALKDGKFIRKVDGEPVFALTNEQIQQWKTKSRRRFMKLDPNCIRWTPYPRPAPKKGE